MTTITTEKRTAADPVDYVRRLNEKYTGQTWGGLRHSFRLVSIDGVTKTGRKRYTLETRTELVGQCRHCDLPATNGYDDLCSGHQRLLGVGPEYDVRADIAPNN